MSFWKKEPDVPLVSPPETFKWPYIESKHQHIVVPIDHSRYSISHVGETYLLKGFCEHPFSTRLRIAATIETNEHVGPWSPEQPCHGSSRFPETQGNEEPFWAFNLYCDPKMLPLLSQVASRVSDPKAKVQLTLHVDSPIPVGAQFWQDEWRRELLRVHWSIAITSRA